MSPRPLAPLALAAAALVLALAAAFGGVLDNGWAPIDDEKNFLANAEWRGLGGPQLRWMVTTRHMGHYIPLTWLTLGADYRLWGLDPRGYHLTSLLFHAATSLLLLLLLWRLLGRAASRATPAVRAVAALAGTLLFAVHPLRVESVAWVSERRDVVCGLFVLLALHAYLGAVGGAAPRRRWHAAALLCYALALLGKGIALPLPLALLALDVVALRRLPADPRQWWHRPWRAVLAEKLPYLAVAGASVAVTLWAISYVLVEPQRLPLANRLAAAVFGISLYLQKTFWPHEIPFVIPWITLDEVSFARPQIVARAAALVLLFAAAIAAAVRRTAAPLAALLVYLAFVLPVSGLLQAGPQLAAHRYTYLPSLAVAALVAGGVAAAGAWLARRAPRTATFALAAAVALLGAALALRTQRQVAPWRDEVTFARAAVASAPRAWQPRYTLASFLVRRGEWDEAARSLRAGLLANPAEVTLQNLGGLLFATCPERRVRDAAEALLLARRAVRATAADDPWALLTLSAALAENGRHAAAAGAAERARELAQQRRIPALERRARRALAAYDAGLPLRMDAADWRADDPPRRAATP